jgi:hypothetical protein
MAMNDQINHKSFDLVAYCGINCGECPIYLAPTNTKIANKLVETFYGKWKNVKVEDFHCGTCRSLVEECWSEECWIRDCCQEKEIQFCYECDDFPCSKLIEWSKINKGYEEALENLKTLKNQKNKKNE